MLCSALQLHGAPRLSLCREEDQCESMKLGRMGHESNAHLTTPQAI